MDRFAYLHFKASDAGPSLTVKVPMRFEFIPRKGQTVSGYGSAIPTNRLALWNGRWHRIKLWKAVKYGNASIAYIGKPGAWIATVWEA